MSDSTTTEAMRPDPTVAVVIGLPALAGVLEGRGIFDAVVDVPVGPALQRSLAQQPALRGADQAALLYVIAEDHDNAGALAERLERFGSRTIVVLFAGDPATYSTAAIRVDLNGTVNDVLLQLSRIPGVPFFMPDEDGDIAVSSTRPAPSAPVAAPAPAPAPAPATATVPAPAAPEAEVAPAAEAEPRVGEEGPPEAKPVGEEQVAVGAGGEGEDELLSRGVFDLPPGFTPPAAPAPPAPQVEAPAPAPAGPPGGTPAWAAEADDEPPVGAVDFGAEGIDLDELGDLGFDPEVEDGDPLDIDDPFARESGAQVADREAELPPALRAEGDEPPSWREEFMARPASADAPSSAPPPASPLADDGEADDESIPPPPWMAIADSGSASGGAIADAGAGVDAWVDGTPAEAPVAPAAPPVPVEPARPLPALETLPDIAGLDDLEPEPDLSWDLRTILNDRPMPRRMQPGEHTRIIAVVVPKGGAGKTATAAYSAHLLSDIGRNVLYVDANSQQAGGADTFRIPAEAPTIVSLAESGEPVTRSAVSRVLFPLVRGRLYVLPGPRDPLKADPLKVTPELYRKALAEVQDEFDYVIIDGPIAEIYRDIVDGFLLPVADYLLVPVNPQWETVSNTFKWLNATTDETYAGPRAYPADQIGWFLNRWENDVDFDFDTAKSSLASWRYLGRVPDVKDVRRAANTGTMPTDQRYISALAEILHQVTDDGDLAQVATNQKRRFFSRR